MFPEVVKLNIEDEIDGFQRTTLERLLNSFNDIESEAYEKKQKYLDDKSKSFNPEIDDEFCIQEDAYFEEINHVSIERELKQEFLNSTAVWLFHLFERQKKRVFDTDKSEQLKAILAPDGYLLDQCDDWITLNKELRLAANAIKHGNESNAAKDLILKYPKLITNNHVVLSKSDINRYINALRVFWKKSLDGKVVL